MPLPRTKFSPHIDLQLLREVLNHNPFADPAKWSDVVDALAGGEGAPTTGRSCRERVLLLMTYFKREQMIKINRYILNKNAFGKVLYYFQIWY